MILTNFYARAKKYFTVKVYYNGAYPDISGDEVNLIIKKSKTDKDTEAVLDADADVSTSGASGIAIFDLSDEDLDITPGNYYLQITWFDHNHADQPWVIHSQTIRVEQNIKGVV